MEESGNSTNLTNSTNSTNYCIRPNCYNRQSSTTSAEFNEVRKIRRLLQNSTFLPNSTNFPRLSSTEKRSSEPAGTRTEGPGDKASRVRSPAYRDHLPKVGVTRNACIENYGDFGNMELAVPNEVVAQNATTDSNERSAGVGRSFLPIRNGLGNRA